MDQPDNQPSGPNAYYDELDGNPEPAGCEPPFIGYIVLNHREPYGRYQGEMYPPGDRTYLRNNNYQGTTNYQGPRGNYNANTRFPPSQYQRGYQNSRFPPKDRREFDRRDPRLYYPAGPPLEPQPRYPMPPINVQLINLARPVI